MDDGELVEGTSRRALLAGAGGVAAIATLGGCATYGAGGGGGGGGGNGGGNAGAGETGGVSSGPGGEQAAFTTTADIPVGGGKIFKDQEVVVTQPQAGTFKAFSAICTHQGCLVTSVSGGTINCNCHGSKFKVADGTVAKSPANNPLAPVALKVEGNNISLA